MAYEEFNKYARYNSDERLCVNESVLSSPVIRMHSHDFIELSYILKGEAAHIVNGKRFSVSSGDLILMSNGCEHTFENGSVDFNWINIIFLPSLFEDNLSVCTNLNTLFNLPYFKDKLYFNGENIKYIHLYKTDKIFRELFKYAQSEYFNAKKGYIYVCKDILDILLIKIARTYMNDTMHNNKKTEKNDLIYAVYNYFKPSSSFNKILRNDIADALHIHPDSLSRLFKKEVGLNFSDFIRNIRLQYAACYLITTNMNINDIINYVGYRDTKNFYNAFKHTYRMTPAQYRKKYKNTIDPKVFESAFDLDRLPK